MAPRFSPHEKHLIRQIIQTPQRGDQGTQARTHRLRIADVQRVLELPEIPNASLLSQRCWMAGGSILRWLCGEFNNKRKTEGDFDFFFPSMEALKQTEQMMLANGYEFRRHIGFDPDKRPTFKGALHKMFTRSARQDKENIFLGKEGDRGSVALEFSSPEGDIIQLITLHTRPTPAEIISLSDFSICQFVMDDRYLYASSTAWSDLLNSRLRVLYIPYPRGTRRRTIKYMRHGFRPYPSTLLKVYSAGFIGWCKRTLFMDY